MYCTVQDDGVDLNINGRLINFHGTITIVSADNLASWNLGGYKNLASAARKCRFCMATAKDMHSKVFNTTHSFWQLLHSVFTIRLINICFMFFYVVFFE